MEIVMGKSTKTRRLREKMRAAAKQSKQTKLDSTPEVPRKEPVKVAKSTLKKQIIITEIGTVTKEDELILKVDFKLLPSKTAFSKIKLDLHFDKQKLNAFYVSIPQGPLARNDFELTPVLDMKGISAGSHTIKIEMYEIWPSGEKLAYASKEAVVQYVPLRREDRLIKIPIVKSVAGADLAVISDSEKDIYREMEENRKKELISRRDEW
jgi:hypothetical protein